LPAIDSKIISTLPGIFTVFGGQRLQLLFRGSRDNFQPGHFHGRCDGHRNTMTLIRSKNGCIFGGYTPVAWGSRNASVPDPSLKSFVFTIRNPHNIPARIFKQKEAANAIHDYSGHGPGFGSACDFLLYGDWQSSSTNYSNLGIAYVNDTGIAGNEVLTGASRFAVEEIEVFEVI
jgi:hypothetical protein